MGMEFAEYTDDDRQSGAVEGAEEEGNLEQQETFAESGEGEEVEQEAEGEGAEAEGEEPEAAEEPNAIPITYSIGEETYEEELTYDEIVDAVSMARQLPQYQNYLKWTKPLVDHLEGSELLRTMHGWKEQGYSDEQIKRGLQTYLQKEGETVTGQGEQSQPDIQQLIQQELDKKLTPIAKTFEQQLGEQNEARVLEHNNKVFDNALHKITGRAYDELDEKEVAAIVRSYRTVFGNNADIKKVPVQDAQAMLIVRDALVKGGNLVPKPKQGMKVPPNIKPGQTTLKMGTPGKGKPYWKEHNVPDQEVKKRANKLFDNE